MRKILILCVLFLAGCATKQYPQSPQLTPEESAAFDCRAIEQEIAKMHSIQSEIDRTAQFDARTVLGFIADFGIGNGLAKESAKDKAQQRLNQLQILKTTKCH